MITKKKLNGNKESKKKMEMLLASADSPLIQSFLYFHFTKFINLFLK